MINAAPVTEMVPVAAVIEIVPLAPVSEMVEEDIAVAAVSDVVPVSEMVPVDAVIEIDLMDRLHNNICNVSIPNTTNKNPYMCYLISTFSFIFSIESYHSVISSCENSRDVAMVSNLKELSNMSKNYSIDDKPLENLQTIRMLLEFRSKQTMFKKYKKYVRMLSI